MRTFTRYLTLFLTGAMLAGGLTLAAMTPARSDTGPTAHGLIVNALTLPDWSHVVYTEGSKSRGFKVIMDNGTNVYWPRLRFMQWLCNTEHGLNTEAAAGCRAEFKASYATLATLRHGWPS